MTEESRLDRIEALSEQNSQQIRGINIALGEIPDTMQAFATAIIEQTTGTSQLRESVKPIS